MLQNVRHTVNSSVQLWQTQAELIMSLAPAIGVKNSQTGGIKGHVHEWMSGQMVCVQYTSDGKSDCGSDTSSHQEDVFCRKIAHPINKASKI
jgi:hypothetical protein